MLGWGHGSAASSRVDSVGARTNEPQRRDERREKRGRECVYTSHLSVKDIQEAGSGLPLRPWCLCGLLEHASTACLLLQVAETEEGRGGAAHLRHASNIERFCSPKAALLCGRAPEMPLNSYGSISRFSGPSRRIARLSAPSSRPDQTTRSFAQESIFQWFQCSGESAVRRRSCTGRSQYYRHHRQEAKDRYVYRSVLEEVAECGVLILAGGPSNT